MYDVEEGKFIIFLIILGILVGVLIFRPSLGLAVLTILLLLIIIMRGISLYNEKQKLDKYKNKLDIINVDKGGIFKLTGVGEYSEELTLKVLAKHLYKEGDYSWYELECDKGEGDKVFVDVEVDDYVKVSVVLENLTWLDISLSVSLETMDDKEFGYVQYKNRKFNYQESDNAVFYRFCDNKKREKFYYWDFKNGNNIISIEKWGSKDYKIYYCQEMRTSQITVLSNKGK